MATAPPQLSEVKVVTWENEGALVVNNSATPMEVDEPKHTAMVEVKIQEKQNADGSASSSATSQTAAQPAPDPPGQTNRDTQAMLMNVIANHSIVGPSQAPSHRRLGDAGG